MLCCQTLWRVSCSNQTLSTNRTMNWRREGLQHCLIPHFDVRLELSQFRNQIFNLTDWFKTSQKNWTVHVPYCRESLGGIPLRKRVLEFFIKFRDRLLKFLQIFIPFADGLSNSEQTFAIKMYLYWASGNLQIRTLLSYSLCNWNTFW